MLTIIVVQILSEFLFSLLLMLLCLDVDFKYINRLWDYPLLRVLFLFAASILGELFPISGVMLQLWFTMREKERAISNRATSSLDSTGNRSFMWTDFRITNPEQRPLIESRTLASTSSRSLN